MALTYYDMEKLMRTVYNQRLSTSLKKIEVRRSRPGIVCRRVGGWRAGFIRAKPRQNRTVCCYLGE